MTTVKIEIHREVEVIVDEEGSDEVGRLASIYIDLTEGEREEAWEKYLDEVSRGMHQFPERLEDK